MSEGRFESSAPWLLARPTRSPHYLIYCRGYALATALRLTLPDALEPGWLWPSLLHWLGALLLAVNGCFAGWLACAVAAILPILFLEDQLSQSSYLAFAALAALASFAGRVERDLPRAIRWLTVGVYTFAALHKLNRDYLDPVVSCANEGLRVLAERSPGALPESVLTSFDSPAWPFIHLTVELGIVVLLVVRPRWGVALAAAMHVPLTIIFAPGFAFTMMSGWLAFFTYDELSETARLLRERLPIVLVAGGVPAGLSRALLFPGRWSSDPDWCVKEVLVWLAAAGLLFAAASLPPTRRAFGWPSRAAGLVVGAFVANGLTPYLGAQLHHTAAMLSNLRIDEGCHNSLVFPSSLAADPYVRLDAVHFAPERADAATRAAIEARLWEIGALYRARRDWCAIHTEALPLRGRYRGRRFATDDLCARDGWPLPEPSLLGFRRFQINLTENCPQRCLH